MKTFKHIHALLKDDFGRYRTASLFWEFRLPDRRDKYPPLFTTKDHTHTVKSDTSDELVSYPSLKEIYMSYDHIPYNEYEFALDVFNSWEHWLVLCQSKMKTQIESWREELAIRLKANAIKAIIAQSREFNSAGLKAANYLADEGYLPKKVGRMSKEEKERERKLAAGVSDTLKEDMERLGLNLVNGSRK